MAAGLGRGATRVCVLCVNALYDRAGAPAAAWRVRPAARGAVVAARRPEGLSRSRRQIRSSWQVTSPAPPSYIDS